MSNEVGVASFFGISQERRNGFIASEPLGGVKRSQHLVADDQASGQRHTHQFIKAKLAELAVHEVRNPQRCNAQHLGGWREVLVTTTRTKRDFAQAMKHLVELYASADVIRVVLDNLNTHKI